tara:strand:- start:357 stop:1601 length:1245 start_codon:yes stop_codon:yes gene_type:complete
MSIKKLLAFQFILIFLYSTLFSQGPEITSWVINTTGATGYGGIQTNVQQINYTNTDVYVSCTCIPGYDIGPWAGNPNTPANQNFVFKITRNPIENTASKTATGLGHIGVWINGVSIFNAKDAFSYNNQDIWHQDAVLVEGPSFDDCLGHPAPNGEYHTHLNPTCLYDDLDDQNHSPIIGYAFDGFPIYGAYGYAATDGSGGIKKMETSYQLRNITQRNTLPDGTSLNNQQQGPAVSSTYPLGYYIEDYEYIQGFGDLDEFNGRFCITPEYPNGTYAYFVTINEQGGGAYPYVLGPQYYGTVQSGNTGFQSGHNSIPSSASEYTPSTSIGEILDFEDVIIYPNPSEKGQKINIRSGKVFEEIQLIDISGKLLLKIRLDNLESNPVLSKSLEAGSYSLRLISPSFTITKKILILNN